MIDCLPVLFRCLPQPSLPLPFLDGPSLSRSLLALRECRYYYTLAVATIAAHLIPAAFCIASDLVSLADSLGCSHELTKLHHINNNPHRSILFNLNLHNSKYRPTKKIRITRPIPKVRPDLVSILPRKHLSQAPKRVRVTLRSFHHPLCHGLRPRATAIPAAAAVITAL